MPTGQASPSQSRAIGRTCRRRDNRLLQVRACAREIGVVFHIKHPIPRLSKGTSPSVNNSLTRGEFIGPEDRVGSRAAIGSSATTWPRQFYKVAMEYFCHTHNILRTGRCFSFQTGVYILHGNESNHGAVHQRVRAVGCGNTPAVRTNGARLFADWLRSYVGLVCVKDKHPAEQTHPRSWFAAGARRQCCL